MTLTSMDEVKQPFIPSGMRAAASSDAASRAMSMQDMHTNSAAITNVDVSLTFEHIVYTAGEGKKRRTILHGISGHVQSGEMLAILGPSGAGKSTLLDILAQRSKKGTVSGDIQMNGHPIESGVFRRVSAYVQQEDLLQSYLSVRESIFYAANLRTPPRVKKDALERRTEHVIRVLRIDHVQNSKIGSETVRGVSGGEKKRCAIGMELVTSPSLLFLDEPTTGLDTFTALHLVTILKDLARSGVAVIFSIHQPRSGIYRLFDKVLLLSGTGEEAFFGPADEALPFLATIGIAPEYSDNPADFLIDSVSNVPLEDLPPETNAAVSVNGDNFSDNGDNAMGGSAGWIAAHARAVSTQGAAIAAAFRETCLPEIERDIDGIHARYAFGTGLPKAMTSPYCRNIFTQMRVVATRSFLNKIRDPVATLAAIIVAIFFAILIGSVYFKVGYSQGSIQNRMGVIFFIVMNTAFSSLGALNVFMVDRALFVREHRNGMYSVAAYYVGKIFQDVPISLLVNFAFDMIVYFMVGLQRSLEKVMIFYLVCTLTMLNSYFLCLFISGISKNVQVANVIAPLTIVLLLLPSGGILISLDSLPIIWRWIKYVSFVRYGLSALVINEFDGIHFECTPNALICILDGKAYAEGLGYYASELWHYVAISAGSVGIYLILGYLSLLFFRRGEGK